jgi:heat shock protein HslJ
MAVRITSALLALIVLLPAAAGCGGAGGRGEEPAAAPAGSWELVSGTGPEGEIEILESHPITLVFEDDARIGGTAACNSYGASARIEDDRFELHELAQTEMACEPPAVMAAEAAYLQALQRAQLIREEGERLVLSGPDVELTFEPLAPVSSEALVGTAWELDTVMEGETASTPGAPGATLLLDSDGGFEGHTGCRGFTGGYELRGDEVRVTRLAMRGDVDECSAAAVEQDRLVAAIVGDGFRAEVDGDRLTLSSAGEEGLVYRAAGG